MLGTLSVGVSVFAQQDQPTAEALTATRPVLRLLDDFTVLRFGRDEGIPEVAVQAVGQTADGFLWCLTQNYLLQFDGHSFVAYDNLDSDPIQKPWPILYRGWAVGPQGVPWVYGQRGCGFRSAQGWSRVDVEGSYHRFIVGLLPDAKGNFWAVASDGICRLEEGRLSALPEPCMWRPITSAIQEGDGLLLGTRAGLVQFRSDGSPRYSLMKRPEITDVTCLQRDHAGCLIICCKEGLVRLHGATLDKIPLPFSYQIATTLLEDPSGAIWVGTKHGLFRYADGRWSELGVHDFGGPLDVLCLSSDSAGHLWAGTGEGLLHLRPRVVRVLHANPHRGHQIITSVMTDREGVLWIGSAEDGVLRLDRDCLIPAQEPGLPTGMAISALGQANDGGLWVGTQGGGLFYSGPGGSRHVPDIPGRKERAHDVTAILECEAGRLWIGTSLGLFTLTNSAGRMRLAPAVLKQSENISATFPHRITAMALDADGSLWAGAENLRVMRVDHAGKDIVHDYGAGLPGAGVKTLYRDRDAKLWVGTSLGLGLYDGNRHWQKILASQGLVDGEIRQMIEDQQGRMWLGTRRGLQVFMRSELEAVAKGQKNSAEGFLIGLPEGMDSEVCTPHASPGVAADAEGHLFFATTDGLAVVDPARVYGATNVPSPVIQLVMAGAETVYKRQEIVFGCPAQKTITASAVTLAPPHRELTFRFAAPIYDSPQRVRFRWRLDGVDTEWSPISTERQVRYSSLAPGQYFFRVMAGWQGVWRETETPFVFHIRPYFYERRSVQFAGACLCAVIISVLASLLQRMRYRRRIRLIEHAHAMEEERSRIARDLHDELGSGLTQIGLLGDLVCTGTRPADGIRELCAKISARARNLAGALDEIVWAVNPSNDNSPALSDYFSRYAQEFLHVASLNCEINVEPLPEDTLSSGMRHQVFLAFKEALNNIVVHAKASTVKLDIRMHDGELTLRLEDDGCGFDGAAGTGSPDGLRGMSERLARLGGRLTIESLASRGTLVVFRLPIKAGRNL